MASQLINRYLCKKTTELSSVGVVPSEFTKCQVSIVCYCTLSDAWTHGFNYATDGEPQEVYVGKGCTPFNMIIDQCLLGMKVGEVYRLALKADAGMFSDLGEDEISELLKVLSDDSTDIQNGSSLGKGSRLQTSVILIDLTLISIVDQGKDIFLLTCQEKLDIAKELKSKGADIYWTHLDFSFLLFSRALKYVICTLDDVDPDLEADMKLLKVQCYLNLSACQLQREAYTLVINNCTKALKLDPTSIKALFRRAQAYAKNADFESAEQDLEKALTIEPNNKLFQSLFKEVQQKRRQQEHKLASAMSKMFT